jgi:uncharacterized protein (TIGR02246 family)
VTAVGHELDGELLPGVHACADVVLALCDAFDRRDADAAAALFADDGQFVAFGQPMAGREAIRAGLGSMPAGPAQRHLATNIRARPGDGGITVDAVFSVYHFGAAPLSPVVMLDTVTELAKVDGRWLITRHSGRPLS